MNKKAVEAAERRHHMSDYVLHPLDPCFARVRWANEHLWELKNLIDDIHVRQVNAFGIKLNPMPPHDLTLPSETFVVMRLPILVGEIAYNLRSALDYLVFELAKLDSGIEQSDTQFPLEDKPEGFERSLKGGRLKGINPPHIAEIERLQPYNGCAWARRLRDVSNPDKHRHFVKASGTVGFTVHSSLEKDLSRIVGYERYANHPTSGQPPVKVKVHVAADHTFADGSPVIESIEEIEAQISNALSKFKP